MAGCTSPRPYWNPGKIIGVVFVVVVIVGGAVYVVGRISQSPNPVSSLLNPSMVTLYGHAETLNVGNPLRIDFVQSDTSRTQSTSVDSTQSYTVSLPNGHDYSVYIFYRNGITQVQNECYAGGLLLNSSSSSLNQDFHC